MRIGTSLALLAAAMVMAVGPGEALADDRLGSGLRLVGDGLHHKGFKSHGLHHKRFKGHRLHHKRFKGHGLLHKRFNGHGLHHRRLQRHNFSRPFQQHGIRNFRGPFVIRRR